MKHLKNIFSSKYFKSIISVFFVAIASVFIGSLIANGANYMSSNFLNIDSGGAYIYGNVGIGTIPNTKLHINATAGSDIFRAQGSGGTKMFIDDTGYVGIGGFFTPSNSLEVSGNIEADNILNRNGYSLLSTEYINSDINGTLIWTNNVLTINGTVDCGTNCWQWGTTVATVLPSPALGFKLRGSSDDGGFCQVTVDNMFAANITNVGYTPTYTLDGTTWPAGGSFAGSNAGGMYPHPGYIFSELAYGQKLNQQGQSTVDNWGYIKPYGLDIIPAGRTVRLRGGSWDGGGGQYINCYLDILYATEYKSS